MTLTLERTEDIEMGTQWITGRKHKNVDRNLLVVDHDARNRQNEVNIENLEKLKAQILVLGEIIKPIDVWANDDGKLIVEDGRTRLLAYDELTEAGYKLNLPVLIVSKPKTLLERLQREYISNEGKPFEMEEKAQRFAELLEIENPETGKRFTQTEIAEIFGVTQANVSNCLRLLEAFEGDSNLKEAVQNGEISASTAIQAVRQSKPKKQRKTGGSKKPNKDLVYNLIRDSQLTHAEGSYWIELNEDQARVIFPEYFEEPNDEEGDF